MFKGFIQRIWGQHGINKIVMLMNGVVMVRTDTEIGQHEVIQAGIYHLDSKPFIVKAWHADMDFSREELHTVPTWIKLPRLDFKYWSPKGLSKLGSLIGKPLMVDQNTERKIGLNFARLMVEVDMNAALPDIINFRNEKGQLIEQKVTYEFSQKIKIKLTYEWKSTLCTYCKKYGHSEEICRKKNMPRKENKKKDLPQKEETTQVPGQRMAGNSKGKGVSEKDNKYGTSKNFRIPDSKRKKGLVTGSRQRRLDHSKKGGSCLSEWE